MIRFSEIKEALLHLVFPHVCSGCGTDLLHNDTCLCIKCIDNLPRTRFEFFIDNPVEKRFYGRLPLVSATAHYYFTKNSLVSHLVHQVKYKGNRELGIQLGRLMGDSIRSSGRFGADVMIPLPLFGGKERKRGYNQSLLLCEGIASYLPMPVLTNVISRPVHTETQTRKGRVERWENIEGRFVLKSPGLITGKHVLLVDDVITTGATLESCGNELLKAGNVSLSVACLCHAFS